MNLPRAVSWEWMEGARAFEVLWGLVAGSVCFVLGFSILWWWLPAHRRSLFGARIDPQWRLQLAYGLFCLAMAATNVLCRAIPHAELPYVHPTYAAITLALVVGLAPRVVWVATHPHAA